MDIGAILLRPFDACHLCDLHLALERTRAEFAKRAEDHQIEIPPIAAAYAAHSELGHSLVVHLRAGDHAGLDFFVQAFPAIIDPVWPPETSFGAAVSGYLNDVALERGAEIANVPRAWTVLFERRSGEYVIYRGFMHTFEWKDSGDGRGPLKRLAAELAIPDVDLLRQKLEAPDTRWVPTDVPPPNDVVAAVRARLSIR